jgi:hypothetical protein
MRRTKKLGRNRLLAPDPDTATAADRKVMFDTMVRAVMR